MRLLPKTAVAVVISLNFLTCTHSVRLVLVLIIHRAMEGQRCGFDGLLTHIQYPFRFYFQFLSTGEIPLSLSQKREHFQISTCLSHSLMSNTTWHNFHRVWRDMAPHFQPSPPLPTLIVSGYFHTKILKRLSSYCSATILQMRADYCSSKRLSCSDFNFAGKQCLQTLFWA